MASEKAKSTIVIKKIKKGGHGHHGGAWKIAYADFVTAMMAFFLLMWLLGSTTKGDLQGIASYFTSPLQVALAGGSGAGDANSIIKGGGKDLSQPTGQTKSADTESEKRRRIRERAEQARRERQQMEALKLKLDSALQLSPKLADMRNQIRVEITPDGLRITIVDDLNRPMFALGGAEVQPYMRDLLREIGVALVKVPNKVIFEGHTDSMPYQGGGTGYGNWELSADRANASRRELHAVGLTDERVMRVLGLAASQPLNLDDPTAAVNRRISISVLTRDAQERLSKGPVSEVAGADVPPAPPARPAWVEPVRPVVPAAAPAPAPTAGRAPGIPG
jgi:chemotaxis protein MotB